MKPGALQALAQETTESLDRCQPRLADAIAAAEADRPGTRAATYDGIPGQRSTPWCWTHEREVKECHRHTLACTGESITVSDPTGEAALRPDPTERAMSELTATWAKIHGLARRVEDLTAWLLQGPETKAEARRREDERKTLTEDNARRCWSCARIEQSPGQPWNCGCTNLSRTDVGLDEPKVVCKWTRRHLNPDGTLPSVEDVEQKRQGKYVRRSA